MTYDWDTDTLFVVGDGGTSVVQVTKTGQLIDSMTLAPGSSPQGTDFYDTEGLTYVGGGKFVVTEERDRQANLFTYVAGTHAQPRGRADGQARHDDREHRHRGHLVRPADERRDAGSSSSRRRSPRGSSRRASTSRPARRPTARRPRSTRSNLFDPALAGPLDFADVFALSNLPSLTGPDASHLLVLSQESGKIVNIDRTGHVSSSLTIAPTRATRCPSPTSSTRA